MPEYHLQKRTLSSWSYVTWYDDLEQAKVNLIKASANSGYSWRIVELKVIEESINGSEINLEPDGEEAPQIATEPVKTGWGATPVAGGWGKPLVKTPNEEAIINSEQHGSKGSVWLGNPTTKEKKRVPAAEAATMMAEGWVKAGPRTVL